MSSSHWCDKCLVMHPSIGGCPKRETVYTTSGSAQEFAIDWKSRAERAERELGKYADVPSFEYWKDRAEKAEADNAVLREALENLASACKCKNGCEPDDMTCATNAANKALSSPSPGAKLLAQLAQAKDALLSADRYFKAKDGVYQCDPGLCEIAAKHSVDKVLAAWEAGL